MWPRRFDAFGTPLAGDWDDAGGRLHSGEYAATTTTRGFSAHEHLDAHRLIHMNGRAYDPALGRFLSVDPIIRNPLSSQSLNPYSYVLNNPLSGVDPTGYECNPVDSDSAGCVGSDGHIINQPATADPGDNNSQQGQGVDAADRGPAVDQGRPSAPSDPIKDCGGGTGCVTLPNTVKRTVVDGEEVLVGSREAWCKELEVLVGSREAWCKELEVLVGSRESWWKELEVLAGRRESWCKELEALAGKRARVCSEPEVIAGNRESMCSELAVITGNRESMCSELESGAGNRESMCSGPDRSWVESRMGLAPAGPVLG